MFDNLVADPHSVYPGMKNLFHKFSDHTSVNSYNLPLDGAPSKMSFSFLQKCLIICHHPLLTKLFGTLFNLLFLVST